MATHSSTLAWKISWAKEPGRLQSMGSQRVRHDWVTSLFFSFSCIGEGNGNPLQCSCLENPRDERAWWATVYGVAQSQTRLKQLSSSSSGTLSLSVVGLGFLYFVGWDIFPIYRGHSHSLAHGPAWVSLFFWISLIYSFSTLRESCDYLVCTPNIPGYSLYISVLNVNHICSILSLCKVIQIQVLECRSLSRSH